MNLKNLFLRARLFLGALITGWIIYDICELTKPLTTSFNSEILNIFTFGITTLKDRIYIEAAQRDFHDIELRANIGVVCSMIWASALFVTFAIMGKLGAMDTPRTRMAVLAITVLVCLVFAGSFKNIFVYEFARQLDNEQRLSGLFLNQKELQNLANERLNIHSQKDFETYLEHEKQLLKQRGANI
jgi:hypothetical protein